MQEHAQGNGANQVHVLPQGQAKQTLVLRERVHGVEHLDRDQDRKAHRRCAVGHFIGEHAAANFGELGEAFVEVCLKKGVILLSTTLIETNLRADRKRFEDLQHRT